MGPKKFLWYGGRRYFVNDEIMARVEAAVLQAGKIARPQWVDLYPVDEHDPGVRILVGPGIPLVIDGGYPNPGFTKRELNDLRETNEK